MNEEKSPFVAGAEVAIVSNGGWSFSMTRVTIEKTYRNGNFKLVGREGKWKPIGNDCARLLGSRGWSNPAVRPITPEILECEREAILAQRADIAKSAIYKIPSDKFTEEAIADLERIAKEAKQS